MSESKSTPQSDDQASSAGNEPKSFEEAAEEKELGFIEEFVLFLRENKAWWLVPILLSLAVICLAAYFSTSVLAPFVYPFF